MASINNYLVISKISNSIIDTFAQPNKFKDNYLSIPFNERKAFVRHFIVNNVPYAFKEKPILYEQLTQYLSDQLEIAPNEVKLIGSAKTGFSISPLPDFGRTFGSQSDIDFAIINEGLFENLKKEFNIWANQFKAGEIKPQTEIEKKYWEGNLDNVPKRLARGFIDTHLIPNRPPFELTMKINQMLFLIKKGLLEKYNIQITKVTVSLYLNWESFTKRLNNNTDSIIKNLNI